MVGFHLVLRRALHELDPGKVIPDRVLRAFDALSDGVIVVDKRERIVLVDITFEATSGSGETLPWCTGPPGTSAPPWNRAPLDGRLR